MCDKYMTKTNTSKVMKTNACKDDELQKNCFSNAWKFSQDITEGASTPDSECQIHTV